MSTSSSKACGAGLLPQLCKKLRQEEGCKFKDCMGNLRLFLKFKIVKHWGYAHAECLSTSSSSCSLCSLNSVPITGKTNKTKLAPTLPESVVCDPFLPHSNSSSTVHRDSTVLDNWCSKLYTQCCICQQGKRTQEASTFKLFLESK